MVKSQWEEMLTWGEEEDLIKSFVKEMTNQGYTYNYIGTNLAIIINALN